MSHPNRKPRVSIAPLLELVGPTTIHVGDSPAHPTVSHSTARQRECNATGLLAELAGTSRRTIDRWKHEGIPLEVADRVACWLGVPSALLWSDVWHLTDDELAS